MCTNRLVQHGLQVRLQLFKTQNKGWGIRCLDDVAKGSFVCIYAGEEKELAQTNDFTSTRGPALVAAVQQQSTFFCLPHKVKS